MAKPLSDQAMRVIEAIGEGGLSGVNQVVGRPAR